MAIEKKSRQVRPREKATVVIPVIKRSAGLITCLDSLKATISEAHKVIIIETIKGAKSGENQVAKAIRNYPNFSLTLTDQPLGFIECCHKAVFELDKTDNDILLLDPQSIVTPGFLEESMAVLHLHEKHGVVCPRSNQGIFTAILRQPEKAYNIDEYLYFFSQLKGNLARYSVIPTGSRFCLLIKRNLINNFGLFDPAYHQKGRVEDFAAEYDFCLRINRYGYSSILANHAFVFDSAPLPAEKKAVSAQSKKNRNIFYQRYPYYIKYRDNYLTKEIDPVDYFASSILAPIHQKKRFLFYLTNLSPTHNGTTEYTFSLIKEFYKIFKDKYEFYFLIQREADEFHQLSKGYPNVYYPDTIDGVFDVAFVPSQLYVSEDIIHLNKLALNIIYSLLDIILLRCFYLSHDSTFIYDVVRLSLLYSSGILTISNFTHKDLTAFFPQKMILDNLPPIKTVYLGAITGGPNFKKTKAPFENFILLMGSSLIHKAIQDTIDVIRQAKINKNIIVIGLEKKNSARANIIFLKSGNLKRSYLEVLFDNCDALLFPSHYEGFGLPVLEGLSRNKPIILYENEINRELKDSVLKEFQANLLFFREFKEIPSLINKLEKTSRTTASVKKIRDWKTVAIDTEKFIDSIIHRDLDITRLKNRWLMLNSIQEQIEGPLVKPYLSQLYVDVGNDFNELHSNYHRINGEERRITFNLAPYDSEEIKQIRFDPINQMSIIRLKQITIITQDQRSIPIDQYQTNAFYRQGSEFTFLTNDPYIIIDVKHIRQPRFIHFDLEFIGFGDQAVQRLFKILKAVI